MFCNVVSLNKMFQLKNETSVVTPDIRGTSEKRHLFVALHVDTLQLAEAHQIRAHQDPQLLPLPLPLLAVPAVALVLHPHPQLVHLGEVEQHEIHGVADVAGCFFTVQTQVKECSHTAPTSQDEPLSCGLSLPISLHTGHTGRQGRQLHLPRSAFKGSKLKGKSTGRGRSTSLKRQNPPSLPACANQTC